MPLTQISLGVQNDRPMISPEPFIWRGNNIRVRSGAVETLGLYGPVKTVAGSQIVLSGSGVYRKVFTTPSTATGQILCGSNTNVTLLQFDPTSTPASGRRWETFDITPSALPAASDAITDPSSGRVEIAPVWWFYDQDDLVVGARAAADEGVYVWDRQSGNSMAAITPSTNPDGGADTPIPRFAVGGGIINRILVLLGCQDFAGGDPFLTIRWSDQFDFGQWTPSTQTVSGEIKLEGGTRIVGGGVTGYGVIAWTDKRMAVLTETFDASTVFSRRYIDGGRGLLANNAWCEADGQIWWLDEARTLNVFDGGRPRQIINTNKLASIERLSDPDASRVFLTPNPEFGEVIITYPSTAGTDTTSQLVYNYLFDVWYPWSLSRTGWHPRVGVIRPVSVDSSGNVWQQDFDTTLVGPWATGTPEQISPDDVTAYDWSMESNLVTTADPGYTSFDNTKVTLDQLYAPADGVSDSFTVEVTGFREPRLTETTFSEVQTFDASTVMQDYRVGGKAVSFKISGSNQKTVWRFGAIEIAGQQSGQR